MLKRFLALLTAAAAALALCSCGPGGARPASSGGDTSPEAPAGMQAGLCALLNYGRLYAFPLEGGEKRLLADERVTAFARKGTEVLAAFEDGSVRLFDLADGSERPVAEFDAAPTALKWCDSGFLCTYYSMSGPRYWFYDLSTGEYTHLVAADDTYYTQVSGDTICFIKYDARTDESRLISSDMLTDRVNWQRPVGPFDSLYAQNGTIYLCRVEEDDAGEEQRTWCRVEAEDGALTELALPFDPDLYSLRYIGNGGCVVESGYEDGFRLCFAGDDGVEPIDFSANYDFAQVEDSEANTLLITTSRSIDYAYEGEDPTEGGWTLYEQRFLLSAYDGTATEVNALDKEQMLFADGDFPAIDSSTARKPVTKSLYELFCLNSGSGGRMPLCSTTHNAWLNIADGTVDLALLAAPTQEEQDVLRQKGVEVEMKLYGGDALVFISNAACGVEELTLDELRAVFRGEIRNWAQLGGADHEIHVLYRDSQSGSQRLFEKLLFGGKDVPDMKALGFEQQDAMSTIVNECLDDPYAIGYSIMTYLDNVYEHEDLLAFRLEGYAATPENVRSGDYPLGTRGYVVIRSDEPEGSPARRLFDWFGCPVCDDILTSNGIVPLHDEKGA